MEEQVNDKKKKKEYWFRIKLCFCKLNIIYFRKLIFLKKMDYVFCKNNLQFRTFFWFILVYFIYKNKFTCK